MRNKSQEQDSSTQSQDLNKGSDQKDSNISNQNIEQDRSTGQSDQDMTHQKPAPSMETMPSETMPPSKMETKPSETETMPSKGKKLPKTAGELPLIAFIGLLSLGAATGTRVLSRAKSR
jgi:hypothetical protein